MQLDKNTIEKLEKLKSEAKAQIESSRAEILNHITVNSKLEVIIHPDSRDVVKGIVESSAASAAQIKEYTELIRKIEEANISLEMNGRDYNSRRQILNSKIMQAEKTISQGISQGVISKGRVDELESTVADCRIALKKMDKILTPIENKLSSIPEAGLAVLQQKPAIEIEGF